MKELLIFFGIIISVIIIINCFLFKKKNKNKFYVQSFSEDEENIYIIYSKINDPFYSESKKIKKK